MKWIKLDPTAFLEGVIGLSAEQRGFYATLICLLYARAPHGEVTDDLVVKAIGCRPQVWRRVKASLMAQGKVRDADGKLTANRVETEVQTALKLMANMASLGRVSAAKRNKNKDISSTGPLVKATTTTTTTEKKEKEKTLSKGFSPSLSEEVAERRKRVQQEMARMTDDEISEWIKAHGPNGAHHG